ncbi:hypothetical protein [Aeromonas hydrophila]|uniref:hypothetical protein n=1 Tax=Aeromonas hydrophila TaxID=644 RepID=UPI003D1A2EC0
MFLFNEFINPRSNRAIFFLPSVRSKPIYPYYPRISWANELNSYYNVFYIADPYQNEDVYKDSGGSWFISPSGVSCLNELSSFIKDLCVKHALDEILFYGSSMGGYASICLSMMHNNSMAISECPQLFLDKHPGSRHVLNTNNILSSTYAPLSFYDETCKPNSIKMVCSIHDRHYQTHVLPFIEEVKDKSIAISFSIHLFSSEKYPTGHVALNKDDAINMIHSCFDTIPNEKVV